MGKVYATQRTGHVSRHEVLLVEKKRAARKAKTKLARKNAKRSAAIVEEALESIVAHRELLKRQATEDQGSG